MIDHRGGATLHGHQHAQHEWQDPPPGAGRMKVCKHCAQRRTPDTVEQPCRRNNGIHDPQPVTDYDPIP